MDAAYRVFYKEGFARARVDVIADAAGVSKRTFYYHFDSKDALLSAVLEAQHDLVLARIANWTRDCAGDPVRMVEVLFGELAAWAKSPTWQGSGFTRSAMELSDLPGHPARAVARRHKAAVEAWLCAQLTANGVLSPKQIARQVMLLLEGCQSLILIHNDPGYAACASEAATVLVSHCLSGASR